MKSVVKCLRLPREFFTQLIVKKKHVRLHAAGCAGPCFFELLSSMYAERQTIVLQILNLLFTHKRQPAVKIPEDAVIRIIVPDHVHSRPDEFNHLIGHHFFLLIQKARNLRRPEDPDSLSSIGIEIAGDNRKVPVMIALLPDKPADLTCRGAYLLLRVSCLGYMNLMTILLLAVIAIPAVPEQILLHELKLLAIRKSAFISGINPFHRPYLRARLLRQRTDLPIGLARHMEKPVNISAAVKVLRRICGENHRDTVRQSKEFPHDLQLYRSKAGEAVQHDAASLHEIRPADDVTEHARNLLCRQIVIRKEGAEPVIDGPNIRKLHGKTVLLFFPGHLDPAVQIRLFHPVLQKLGDQRLHFFRRALAGQGSAENPELLLFCSDHPLGNQALPEIIQNRQRIASHLLKDPPRQPVEAEHVQIHHSLSRMHLNNFLLGLHRELLRNNDEKLSLRFFHGFPDDFTVNLK